MFVTRSRMFRRSLAVAALCAGAGACDIGPATRTRPGEALLSPADLARVRTDQAEPRLLGAGGATGAPMSGNCAEVEGVIAQLQAIGAGRLKFSGSGQLALDERAWKRLPGEQRTILLRALAVQNRCKTGAAKGTAIVRSAQGPRIVGRYREP